MRQVRHAARRSAAKLSGRACIALAVALPLAAWVASRAIRAPAARGRFCAPHRRGRSDRTPCRRRQRRTARRWKTALNQTAERLGKNFAELESGRHELAVMLDSMQEAVVAITPEGFVRWSNAVMQRIAGHADLVAGRPLVHSVRDPELLACVRGALERRELCVGRASLLAPGPRLRDQRRAAALRRRAGRAARRDQHRGRAKIAARLRRQRQPRTAHAAHVDPGLRGNADRRSQPEPGNHARISRRHPQERQPHEPAH